MMLTEKQLLASQTVLRRYASTLVRTRADRDDLVQDVLCRGWQKRHLFDGEDAVPWLLVICHNTYVNQMRKLLRENGTPDKRELSIEEGQSVHHLGREVAAYVETMPEDQRRVLMLNIVEGNDYEQTALIMGTPCGTVRSRLARARETLREHFA